MKLTINGSTAVCPECSGLVKRTVSGERYRCIDCGAAYEVVGEGHHEKILEVKEITREGKG